MPKNSFILSSSSKSKEFSCLSVESNITILNATLINPRNNWQSLVGNDYLEICFSCTDENDKQWGRVQPLRLLISENEKSPIKSFNIVFASDYLSKNTNFFNHLSIKLVERNITEPVEWQVEFEFSLIV
jgi:hypothetical protein